ncbi:hypothetical protein OHAE_3913 [Ochrobactrum soli]|uniref:Uncharacterized protein n=1 Tax=Ochrobactrum soli TaxID=2448455 RepID=A0A2P9HIM8_9HYPH|nr:hypothetical protein OHAE_3913 [[Ochrobactrum] soli]
MFAGKAKAFSGRFATCCRLFSSNNPTFQNYEWKKPPCGQGGFVQL